MIDEVVVTAQKREERLQDVPAPVSAVSAERLLSSNQVRLQDYYNAIPGLNLSSDSRGAPALAIRGLVTSTFSNPTVATVVDDVPYTATTAASIGWFATEIDPNELSRLEVLRGPQGVLYGAASLGGIVKFVTVKPSTEKFSGYVQASLSDVAHGDQGYGLSGAVNVPLSDAFAVRVSAFGRYDSGYIDNVLTGERDVNDAVVSGGRISALWELSSKLSLQLSALYQKSDTGGTNYAETQFTNVPLGTVVLDEFQQVKIVGTGGYVREVQAYTATLDADLGPVKATSVTGYTINTNDGSIDYGHVPVYQTVTRTLFPNEHYAAHREDNKTTKLTQELRFSGTLGSRLDWMIGGFYTDEETDLDGGPRAFKPSGEFIGTIYRAIGLSTYEEFAVFGNLTFRVSDSIDVQFGARRSENKQLFRQIAIGPGVPLILRQPSPAITTDRVSEDDSVTYLVTPRWKITDDMMLYARFSSGYRPGGVNSRVAPGSSLPTSFGPDKTQNYEVGFKGAFLDNRLSIDASAFYTDWRDIQINVFVSPSPYGTNGSGARTQGVELSAQLRPGDGLSIGGWVAWVDAELTKPFPPTSAAIGRSGDRLPYNSRWSGALSIDQEFPLGGDLTGFAGLSVAYVGERLGEFATITPANPTARRPVYPAYTKVDLRAGVRGDDWRLNVYVNNLTDEAGRLTGGIGTFHPTGFTYIQPRTAGLSLTRNF